MLLTTAQIKSVQWALPTATAIQLMNSFIISRVDYCNSTVAPLYQMQHVHVQSIINVAAQLTYGLGHFNHVSDLIQDRLHWLRGPQRISFNCALLAYKVQHGLAPNYIVSYCQMDVISPAPPWSTFFNSRQSCYLTDQDQVRWMK